MGILAEIYHDWHTAREKPRTEEQKEWSRSEALWLEAEKSLDAELFRELQMSVLQLMNSESCREFEAGFRLGAQLMLELYAPAQPV